MKSKVKSALVAMAAFFICVADSAGAEVNLDAYTLSDGGAVFLGGRPVSDMAVSEADAGKVRNWVVLSENKDAGADATGVFFFGEDGRCVGFLPLENENECQGILFRPDGEFFVLVTGSGVRMDMFFNVYRLDGMEKTAEFAGLRDTLVLLGPSRFMFTRIDGIREGGSFPGLGYGLRLSAVIYDTSFLNEIVLKEATDKQNFRTGEVSEDESSVTVTEEFVGSEKDWRDEGKIKTREIRVGIPAARDKTPSGILGGITPHHGLALPMIVRFYEHLPPGTKRVWLLAPDHFRRVRRQAAICGENWAPAERTLEADGEAIDALSATGIVEERPEIFAGEHGITLHIPLIARYCPDAKVVPMLLNPKIPDMGLLILRNKLRELFREGDIVILSMDLSHYKTPEAMAAEDKKTLAVLKSLRFGETDGLDVDARRAAALALMLFKDMGAKKGDVLEHTDSSAVLGRRAESGTSYATVMYRSQIFGE
ncbi:MAG: AmmeMemoRadiSam system protein B [Synergistaceae bacterium]|nr:AmmeMemoRadiSam system protein B [Synergistaceae bacterium]